MINLRYIKNSSLNILIHLFILFSAQSSFALDQSVIIASNDTLIDLLTNKIIFKNENLSIKNTTKLSENQYIFETNRGEIYHLELGQNIKYKKLPITGYCPTNLYESNSILIQNNGNDVGSIDFLIYDINSGTSKPLMHFEPWTYISCPIVISGNKILLKVSSAKKDTTHFIVENDLTIRTIDLKGYTPELYLGENTLLAWKNGYVLINEQADEISRLKWQSLFSKVTSHTFFVSGYSKKMNTIFFTENKFSIFSGHYNQSWSYNLSNKSFSKLNKEITVNVGGILE